MNLFFGIVQLEREGVHWIEFRRKDETGTRGWREGSK